MYKGKRSKSTKNIWLMASVVMILAMAIGGTVAYIATSAGPVENTFTLGQVPITVVEEFNGEVKNNVKIQNTGDVDAYIRATVVVNWVDDDGNIYGEKPEEDVDYQINWTKGDWIECVDGYYYYKNIVKPGDESDILFTKCGLTENANVPDGYTLSVEILAQSIQANGKNNEGKTPVELAWGEAAAQAVGATSNP